jgi:hypothetical protein
MGNSNGFNAVVRNSVLVDLSALVQASIAHYAQLGILPINSRIACISQA